MTIVNIFYNFNKKDCVLNICSQHSEINDSNIVNSSAYFAIDCPKNCPINVHVGLVEFSYYKQKFNSRNILSPENITLVDGRWSVVAGRWSVPWSVVGGFVITLHRYLFAYRRTQPNSILAEGLTEVISGVVTPEEKKSINPPYSALEKTMT